MRVDGDPFAEDCDVRAAVEIVRLAAHPPARTIAGKCAPIMCVTVLASADATVTTDPSDATVPTASSADHRRRQR